MTTQIFERHSGDTGPPIFDTLEGVDDLDDLTGLTAELTRNREPSATCPIVIVSSAARTIRVDLDTWLPTARKGDWRLNYVATLASGGRWTWESGRADIVRVGRNPKP